MTIDASSSSLAILLNPLPGSSSLTFFSRLSKGGGAGGLSQKKKKEKKKNKKKYNETWSLASRVQHTHTHTLSHLLTQHNSPLKPRQQEFSRRITEATAVQEPGFNPLSQR